MYLNEELKGSLPFVLYIKFQKDKKLNEMLPTSLEEDIPPAQVQRSNSTGSQR